MPADTAPVARVLADTGLAHLDRPFDYLVPAALDELAVPGVRVRVRFARRLVDGYLLERVETSEHVGTLSFLERVVSPEPVMSPEIATLARHVADRYAGSMSDVLRLAVPPRHASAEKRPLEIAGAAVSPPPTDAWNRYAAGAAFVRALGEGRPARAVWLALPGEDWPARLAELAAISLAAGRGSVLVVPDQRDLARLDAAMTAALGTGRHVLLSADLGPAQRYRRFLAVRQGVVKAVIGTRAAAFAPIHDAGLFAVFDDGDDVLAEPRAPYPHAREVMTMRSAQQPAALLIGGYARTAESQLLVESGWAHPIVADRRTVRSAAPRVEAAQQDGSRAAESAAAHARLSPSAFAVARAALTAGAPVLVQVPRSGYRPGLACATCRRPARCRSCAGPLHSTPGERIASCRWCGTSAVAWRCSACAGTSFRATAVGSARTAEELGRAFPGSRVITSAAGAVVDDVDPEPALVVATPGAEPTVDGGYGAALLLDGAAMLSRPDLRAGEETLRRWLAAAALVRSAAEGGRVVVSADSGLAAVQALIRWDPGWHAELELASRRELGFPPAVSMGAVDGSSAGLRSFLDDLDLPPGAEVLGPVEVGAQAEPAERALIRIELGRGRQLAATLAAARAMRSARKDPAAVRVRMDPVELV